MQVHLKAFISDQTEAIAGRSFKLKNSCKEGTREVFYTNFESKSEALDHLRYLILRKMKDDKLDNMDISITGGVAYYDGVYCSLGRGHL